MATERDYDASLATLLSDVPLFESLSDLQWKGPSPAFERLAARLNAAVTSTSRRPSRAVVGS